MGRAANRKWAARRTQFERLQGGSWWLVDLLWRRFERFAGHAKFLHNLPVQSMRARRWQKRLA